MANHGHDVTMPARPGAQNTKTILGVVVGYSLDEARQHFLGRWFWLWTHADYPGPASRPLKTPKMCCVGISARASVGYLFAHRCPVQIFLAIAGAARIRHGHHQSPCLSVHVYWTIVGHQLISLY